MDKIELPDNISANTQKLLGFYDLFPFQYHPLWQSIINGKLSKDQIFKAESQHYLRTKAGQILRKDAMQKSAGVSKRFFEAIIDTYLEECTEDDGTPTHLDLIKRFLLFGGFSEKQFSELKNTPGNIAAIALYKDIADRGVGCHIIGAGMVEYFYSQLSPFIFKSYTENYQISDDAAETYKIHGTMDKIHASRAFEIVDEAIEVHGWKLVESAVRDAFVATSFHYDGMLQCATNEFSYWNGKSS
jgi:pyrroloquinoline quinone (PQQ) biosynthesis protein C